MTNRVIVGFKKMCGVILEEHAVMWITDGSPTVASLPRSGSFPGLAGMWAGLGDEAVNELHSY